MDLQELSQWMKERNLKGHWDTRNGRKALSRFCGKATTSCRRSIGLEN